jgi:hypothetical protein
MGIQSSDIELARNTEMVVVFFIESSRGRVSVGTACGTVRVSMVSARGRTQAAKMDDCIQPNGQSTSRDDSCRIAENLESPQLPTLVGRR